MNCAVCNIQVLIGGVLCQQCRDALREGAEISPEQLVSSVSEVTRAALIDHWGRAHALAPVTRLGRISEGATIRILTPTVSRHHAAITLDHQATWRVSDLGSFNGTFVDDKRILDAAVLHDRARIRVGRVCFYFIAEMVMPARSSARAIGRTIRPSSEGEASRSTLEIDAQPDQELVFVFEQPTGGGGAIMRVGDKSVQLTIAQHDLIMLLIHRMLADQDADEVLRGFVAIDDMLARLSLDSSEAGTDNVRQLVRRVRKLLVKAGIGDLIESRRSRGYRLLLVPRLG